MPIGMESLGSTAYYDAIQDVPFQQPANIGRKHGLRDKWTHKIWFFSSTKFGIKDAEYYYNQQTKKSILLHYSTGCFIINACEITKI